MNDFRQVVGGWGYTFLTPYKNYIGMPKSKHSKSGLPQNPDGIEFGFQTAFWSFKRKGDNPDALNVPVPPV